MTALIFRLILAEAADALTLAYFYLVTGPGVHAERNPLVLGLMALGGVQLVVLAKIGVAAWIGYHHDHNHKPLASWYVRLRTVAMSVATASAVVGAGFNVAAIIR